MRPYILYPFVENLGPEGQSVGRRKSVKKNAALLHFLAFSLADLSSGVPRGRAPLGGVAGSRSDQSPSGALIRTSGPALLDGGHRFGRQARCLATAGLFSLPFLVTKKVGLGKLPTYIEVSAARWRNTGSRLIDSNVKSFTLSP